jgi:tetratricopeptide (TPR) repeat protein
LGDSKSAMADYDQALRINPNFLLGYNNRGGARFRSRDYQGAMADFDRVLRINPNYASGYGDRGVVRYALGDYQGAIADHNQALKINPNDADIYFSRGNARDKLGDKQGTLNDYEKSAELYQQRGDIKSYEQVIRMIGELQESTAPNQSTSTTLLAINSSLISGKSSALPSDGSLYEQHSFEGRAGQSVTISVESSDFDTYVALFSPDGELLAKNDDISRSNSNSSLTVALPASGRYRVIVNAYKKCERGRYTLTVR